MDALDLAANLRGYGWDWSKGLHIPRETRPLTRIRFVACAVLSAGLHAFIRGTLHRAVQSFSPDAFGTLQGGSIFDETLPFFIRYFRSTIISTFCAFAIYCILQLGYDQCIIPAVLILRQDPVQWPPAFDAPWFSTSLGDFWGRRWHQWIPAVACLWPRGAASFASAVFHHMALATLNGEVELWRMLVPFGMMSVGVLGERMFLWLMGRKVGGDGLGVDDDLVDPVGGGMFGCSSIIDGATPVRVLVERSVMAFDVWLHKFIIMEDTMLLLDLGLAVHDLVVL
ncbi:hypothetical protein BU15DRAFT_60584 [Melanogaster broomeanus]|nr:hypothetical protein BU15DRAFT_60584 [Melanogaster broomeanus]